MLHGAFKSGIEATNWYLKKIMKAMWKIFDDSPARRDIYIKICEVNEFPLRYIVIFIFPLLLYFLNSFTNLQVVSFSFTVFPKQNRTELYSVTVPYRSCSNENDNIAFFDH